MLMTLIELQQEIIANRIRRNWSSATDLLKTTGGIAEELGEFEHARRNNNREEMIDALADIAIFVLGGFEILGASAHPIINTIVLKNKNRVGQTDH
jgi:NTP pyrophosphatase (non-canonical NTP hydrolase)